MTTQITSQELSALMETGGVKVLDGSWALDGTDMQALFVGEHIPGAQFFDIEAISDHSTDLPHMAPTSEQFAEAVGAMGISRTDRIVIYDRQGLFSAARVWWTFRLMGQEKVQVLQGGLLAWKAAGLPVTSQMPSVRPTHYATFIKSEKIIDLNGLHKILGNPDYLVLDARSQGRFEGTAPEPRAGLRSGHMPGSQSLPFGDLIRDGALKPKEELKAAFKARGLDRQTAITTCGSGVTAAIISMALEEIGYDQAILYDGSWAEWGQSHLSTAVVTGSN